MTMPTAKRPLEAAPQKPKRTLENRINDLPWKDWLLFQKSFFQLGDDAALYGGLIQFFTKRSAQKGRLSRVMIISVSDVRPDIAAHGRKLFRETVAPTAIGRWQYGETDFTPFDFLIVDMRHSGAALAEQTTHRAADVRQFLANCRAVLKEGSFCALLSQELASGAGRYPLPWVLSSLARGSFRLRDEKIGLLAADDAAPTYINVLQAIEEIGPTHAVVPALRVGAPAIREQWVKPRPRPRSKKEILHPAKFPEELIRTFVSELTESGTVVLDPMGGTGSTAVAALDVGRRAVIIELGKVWADIARTRIAGVPGAKRGSWKVLHADASNTASLIPAEFQPVAYTVTSPPYWRILHNRGMHVSDEGQKARQAKGLRTTYSESDADLGNVKDYRQFIDALSGIYECCADVMEPGRILTIVTKNVKFERAQFPIAWDLVFKLCTDEGRFEYAGTTFWCQDDVGLKPFGMGCDWISNILHNYCIHLRVRARTGRSRRSSRRLESAVGRATRES
jgi:DNA modification methylase